MDLFTLASIVLTTRIRKSRSIHTVLVAPFYSSLMVRLALILARGDVLPGVLASYLAVMPCFP